MSEVKPRILIVDDEPDLLTVLTFGLEAEGFAVLQATDGEQGLALARQALPDLIVLDLMLPRMDGLTLCNKLRDAGNNTPVLMLTALDSRDDMLKGFQHGADDYLTKPFDLDILEARMTALIKQIGRAHV